MKKTVLLMIFLLQWGMFGADKYSWDFTSSDVRDILFMISLDSGISIGVDDTVSGQCDFKFSGDDFNLAFDVFLEENRLYAIKEDNVWKVSKIRINENQGKYSLDAFDLYPAVIFEKLSEFAGESITVDTLSSSRISVHFKEKTLEELLELLAVSTGSYSVEKENYGFHVSKAAEKRRIESNDGFVRIEWQCADEQESQQPGKKVLVDIKNEKLSEVIEELFSSEGGEGKNYSFAAGSDVRINRMFFDGKDFDEALFFLCAQNGFNYVEKEGIYFIFQDGEARNQLMEGKKQWCSFELKYEDCNSFINVALKKLGNFEYSVVEDKNLFFALISDEQKVLMEDLVNITDKKQSLYVLNLKYLKPAEVLNFVPPSVDKTRLYLADDYSCIYFTGTEEAYKDLCQAIEICDRPEIRLTYDLLIIQYDETKEHDWTSGFSVGGIKAGDRNGIAAQLGSVLSLKMNVVAAFGLNFAVNLQSSIEENNACVYADTTLHGVNGKNISFQNTNTYRYRDNNLDPETGKPVYSGITKEIVSGIKLDVEPWVSGDGMITSKVTASISRQGIDTSRVTGNPPPTTEKIITTEVCTKSGEPVVLSGLVQQSLTENKSRIPIISKIPILGNLFKSSEENKEKEQMVIILVPRIDGYEIEEDKEAKEKEITSIYEEIMIFLEEEKQLCKEDADYEEL